MKSIYKSILLKLVNYIPYNGWLCGGSIRDILLEKPCRDIDLVVPKDALTIARDTAQRLNATFVPLHEEEGVARVVSKDLIIDFSQFRNGAKEIHEDLLLRDFTINSMAIALKDLNKIIKKYKKETITAYIIDPTGGLNDLNSGLIRCVSKKNLKQDPLRLIRAIRFKTELNFNIEHITSSWIKELAQTILDVAKERIQYELEILMSQKNSCDGIKSLHNHELLLQLVPEMACAIGIDQPGFHHLDVFNHLIEALCQIDKIIEAPSKFFSTSKIMTSWCSENIKKLPYLRFASLFHDIGKPYCLAKRDDGRVTFHQHDKKGAELVKNIGKRLRWSKKSIEFTSRLVRLHMRPFFLIRDFKLGGPTPRAMTRLLKETGTDYPALFMVAMSDALSANGPLTPKDMPEILDKLFIKIHNFYLERLKPVEKSPPLLNGFDIQKIFGIEPGPIIGKILKAVEQAQIERNISSKDEACEFVKRWLKQCNQHHHI